MDAFVAFVGENLWLCLGLGVVLVIVGDEVLGVSRGLFGDAEEDRPPEMGIRRPDPAPESEADPGAKVEDFLPPRR